MTRPAEHVTPQMLLQRCDSPLLLAATRCAIGLAEARGWSAATIAGVFTPRKFVAISVANKARFASISAGGTTPARTASKIIAACAAAPAACSA